MPRTLLKVFSGGGGGVLESELVFTFGAKPELKLGPS